MYMSKQSEENDIEKYFLTKAPVESLNREELRRRWAHLKKERDKLNDEIKIVGDILIAGNPPEWIRKKIGEYIINKQAYL